jgi:hypothetical protein
MTLAAETLPPPVTGPLVPERMFDLDAFERTPLVRDPYDTLTVPRFLRPDALAAVNADYPPITEPTTFMLEDLTFGPAFAAMVDYLRSDDLARRVSAKFGVDVTGLPRMFSVRKLAEPSDGDIHTDSKTKIITVLLYFNTEWAQPGGRLRVLRSATDMDDYAAEIVPVGGTLFAFRRSETSWHGFPSATGERRSLQMQYVAPKRSERGVVHKTSLVKRLKRLVRAFG